MIEVINLVIVILITLFDSTVYPYQMHLCSLQPSAEDGLVTSLHGNEVSASTCR